MLALHRFYEDPSFVIIGLKPTMCQRGDTATNRTAVIGLILTYIGVESVSVYPAVCDS